MFNKQACKFLQFCHEARLPMLKLAYISTRINADLLYCSLQPCLTCAADLDMLARFMVAMTKACLSPFAYPCALNHFFTAG